jgi:hypothetical protein
MFGLRSSKDSRHLRRGVDGWWYLRLHALAPEGKTFSWQYLSRNPRCVAPNARSNNFAAVDETFPWCFPRAVEHDSEVNN